MANTYVNKVLKSNGEVLIDISDSTAVAADVTQGKTIYLASGQKVTGTNTGGGGGYPSVYQDENGYLVLNDEEVTPTGGLTTIASGSFVGTGAYDIALTVGSKMPKTDFWLKFVARTNSEFPYDANYKYCYGIAIVDSDFAHFDLSTVGDSKQVVSDISFDINNSGTVTTAAAGNFIGNIAQVRNATANTINRPNNLRVNRKSTGFEIRFYNSNSTTIYTTGITYDWELVYYGSNPSSDIVEIT